MDSSALVRRILTRVFPYHRERVFHGDGRAGGALAPLSIADLGLWRLIPFRAVSDMHQSYLDPHVVTCVGVSEVPIYV